MSDAQSPAWHQRALVAAQYLIHQHLASRLMHRLACSRSPPVKDLFITAFTRLYQVDLSEAAESNAKAYPSFNAFFTRALRAGARPLDKGASLVCPADGYLSHCGTIERGRLFQAKAQSFGLRELLGADQALAERFADGAFATIYLSPRDYHRVHMPCSGALLAMTHVPGRRFSVNPLTTRLVPRLFARNERLICLFDTAIGPLAIILVGALFVGSIETVWAGEIRPAREQQIARWSYPADSTVLARGAEMGRFNMGSTVILLVPAKTIAWGASLRPGTRLRMGEPMARLRIGAGRLDGLSVG